MATKTFNIGERAVGGRIKVDITGKLVQIKALEWFSKKEVSTGSCMTDEYNAHWKTDRYLNELTSSYYAGKIMDWIKSKVTLTNEGF